MLLLFKGDFREDEVLSQLEGHLEGKKLDLVLSDMAQIYPVTRPQMQRELKYIIELRSRFCEGAFETKRCIVSKMLSWAEL